MNTRDDYHKIGYMIFYKACEELFAELSEIKYALVKGDALSIQIYGKTGMRNYSDIDILIMREDIAKVEAALHKCGFVPLDKSRESRLMLLANSHQVAPWVKYSSSGRIVCEVDLNFKALWGEGHISDSALVSEMLEKVETKRIYGVEVKTLTNEMAFIHMCLHHYRDMNSIYLLAKNGISPKLFEDVSCFISNSLDETGMNRIVAFCEKYKIKEYLFFVIYYTNKVFEDVKGTNFLSMLDNERGRSTLSRYGLSDKEYHTWPMPLENFIGKGALLPIMKDQLTPKDYAKIDLNEYFFMGKGKIYNA